MNLTPNFSLVPWQNIDTVLLDMDGTLLDLNYDNQIFGHLLPAAYAKLHDLSAESAQAQLHSHMMGLLGTMDFYRFDYWREFTGLDMVALHEQAADLICFLPGADTFLERLTRCKKRVLIATNADRQSFAIKDKALQLTTQVDEVISSHDYGVPKENDAFWPTLVEQTQLDPARTLFIDDTQRVLDAAKRFGIAQTLAVAYPDTRKPARQTQGHPSFDHYEQLLSGLI